MNLNCEEFILYAQQKLLLKSKYLLLTEKTDFSLIDIAIYAQQKLLTNSQGCLRTTKILYGN